MDVIKQHLAGGNLAQAIEEVQQQVKAQPAAAELRASLIELLCVAGHLERADDMLGSLARHHPEWLAGAANLRQLIRAQQARLEFHQGKLAEDAVVCEAENLQTILALRAALNEQDFTAAEAAAILLEQQRPATEFRLGEVSGDIRDCDDSLCDFLEALSAEGKFYLWRWSDIESIDFHPPTSPVELVWRRADVELASGKQGEVFVPLVYAASDTDHERLGRVTEWRAHSDGLVTGIGLKQYLVGDDAVGLSDVKRVERVAAVYAD
ncbi:hypothetical protein FE845_06455 [Marinobacter sp. 1-4A]|uniref:type VI secretion system accessory protein TagJ n=1 Tax=Marinobacter sp. 1-4A TaxID=2582919 RepID=UPI0019055782|nr:type VI secretion system accessory protein TagJ [Marinobacter sp. 1-4A]MBK1850973.1 hypothetical protein [Marinobacter sp. 1-4A]